MRSRIAVAAVVLLAGCGTDSDVVTDPGSLAVTDFTDPVSLIDAHFEALQLMDLNGYAALLAGDGLRAQGFQYYPQLDDVEDFPWVQGSSWGYAHEMDMIGNMFNSEFVGEDSGGPVQTIDALASVLDESPVSGGGASVRVAANISVIWGPDDGAVCDAILEFLLMPDANGFLRVHEIREEPRLGRTRALAPVSIVPLSWANIKARYRP